MLLCIAAEAKFGRYVVSEAFILFLANLCLCKATTCNSDSPAPVQQPPDVPFDHCLPEFQIDVLLFTKKVIHICTLWLASFYCDVMKVGLCLTSM